LLDVATELKEEKQTVSLFVPHLLVYNAERFDEATKRFDCMFNYKSGLSAQNC
jgi:hypothetical protein